MYSHCSTKEAMNQAKESAARNSTLVDEMPPQSLTSSESGSNDSLQSNSRKTVTSKLTSSPKCKVENKKKEEWERMRECEGRGARKVWEGERMGKRGKRGRENNEGDHSIMCTTPPPSLFYHFASYLPYRVA